MSSNEGSMPAPQLAVADWLANVTASPDAPGLEEVVATVSVGTSAIYRPTSSGG